MSTPRGATPDHLLERHATVRVLLNARGEWEVVSPHSLRPHRYNNLDEATRAAYAVACRDGPCELVVHDAYHRVVYAQHVDARVPGGAGVPQAPTETAVAGGFTRNARSSSSPSPTTP